MYKRQIVKCLIIIGIERSERGALCREKSSDDGFAAIEICLEFCRNQVALLMEMTVRVGLNLIDPKTAIRSGPIRVLPPTLQVLVSIDI